MANLRGRLMYSHAAPFPLRGLRSTMTGAVRAVTDGARTRGGKPRAAAQGGCTGGRFHGAQPGHPRRLRVAGLCWRSLLVQVLACY